MVFHTILFVATTAFCIGYTYFALTKVMPKKKIIVGLIPSVMLVLTALIFVLLLGVI